MPDDCRPQHFQLQDPDRNVRLVRSAGLQCQNGESVSEDGKITLGVLYEDTHKEELCDVQAEKQEAAKK